LETVEGLTSGAYPLFIQEALAVNVRLALLGKDKKNIRVIYSHFAPLHHCGSWLRATFPNAELTVEASTATAVKRAAAEKGAAAIGTRDAAKRYHLKVLEFPIKQDCKNVTQFFVLGHSRAPGKNNSRTTIVAALPNRPGSLVDFLGPFKDKGVNLCRLISHPVAGTPQTYVFLVDIAGSERSPAVAAALKKARSAASSLINVGSYPVRESFNS
jgi:prephenate dehydratase